MCNYRNDNKQSKLLVSAADRESSGKISVEVVMMTSARVWNLNVST